MSEGELKRRISGYANINKIIEIATYSLSEQEITEKLASILGIEDAKKEFPLTSPEKEKDPEFWSELASERLQWFKKWFGGVQEVKNE